jgi:hypothetical protein
MELKTESTEVTETLQIWAIPRSEWQIERDPAKFPFRYEIRTGSPYQDGSVKVHEQEVSLYVPAGIDLRKKAIETLSEEIKTVKKDADTRVKDLEEQINSLALLEYKPDNVIEV